MEGKLKMGGGDESRLAGGWKVETVEKKYGAFGEVKEEILGEGEMICPPQVCAGPPFVSIYIFVGFLEKQKKQLKGLSFTQSNCSWGHDISR